MHKIARAAAIAAGFCLIAASSAWAQQPGRIRGQIEKVDGSNLAAVAPGNKDELKPGAQIIVMASDKQPDGSVLAKNMYVGRGLTPAM